MKKRLQRAFTKAGIASFGAVPLADCGERLPCRGSALLTPRMQSVLVAVFPYYTGELPPHTISRYACVPDYHRVARKMLQTATNELLTLFPGEEFVPFVDASPIREVYAAVMAGLGDLGKNGLLLTKEYGSYVFLGEIVTSLAVPSMKPAGGECMDCGACRRACPSGAIGTQGVNTARCLSFLTQKKGELTQDETALIRKNGMLWGCDVCQEVCPANLRVGRSPIEAFYQDIVTTFDGAWSTKAVKERAFGFRGVGVLKRNARILEGKEADTREGICRKGGK